MTRHRLDVQAFVNREEIIDFKTLIDKIGRGPSKETLQDYQVPEAQKPYLERVQKYRDLLSESMSLREKMEGSLKPRTPLYKHSSYAVYRSHLDQKRELAGEILENWDSYIAKPVQNDYKFGWRKSSSMGH